MSIRAKINDTWVRLNSKASIAQARKAKSQYVTTTSAGGQSTSSPAVFTYDNTLKKQVEQMKTVKPEDVEISYWDNGNPREVKLFWSFKQGMYPNYVTGRLMEQRWTYDESGKATAMESNSLRQIGGQYREFPMLRTTYDQGIPTHETRWQLYGNDSWRQYDTDFTKGQTYSSYHPAEGQQQTKTEYKSSGLKNNEAVYNESRGGVETGDGKFYATTNKNWTPSGYSNVGTVNTEGKFYPKSGSDYSYSFYSEQAKAPKVDTSQKAVHEKNRQEYFDDFVNINNKTMDDYFQDYLQGADPKPISLAVKVDRANLRSTTEPVNQAVERYNREWTESYGEKVWNEATLSQKAAMLVSMLPTTDLLRQGFEEVNEKYGGATKTKEQRFFYALGSVYHDLEEATYGQSNWERAKIWGDFIINRNIISMMSTTKGGSVAFKAIASKTIPFISYHLYHIAKEGGAVGNVAKAIINNPKLVQVIATSGFTGIYAKEIKEEMKGQPTIEKATIAARELLRWSPLAFEPLEKRIIDIDNRNKAYNKVLNELTTKYGSNSKEVNEFKKAWEYSFEYLNRGTEPEKAWTSKHVEAGAGDKKITEIVDRNIRKYGDKVKIIGTTDIPPQTSLEQPPRGLSGDVDIAQTPKKLITNIYNELKANGYNVKLGRSTFGGSNKYHITLDGQEFINAADDATGVTYAQIRKHMNLFDITSNAWVDDPEGVGLLNLRDQMRAKTWAGYVEGSRPKDITDVVYTATREMPVIDTRTWKGTVDTGKYNYGKLYDFNKENVGAIIKPKAEIMNDVYKGVLEPLDVFNDVTGKWESRGFRKVLYYGEPSYNYPVPTKSLSGSYYNNVAEPNKYTNISYFGDDKYGGYTGYKKLPYTTPYKVTGKYPAKKPINYQIYQSVYNTPSDYVYKAPTQYGKPPIIEETPFIFYKSKKGNKSKAFKTQLRLPFKYLQDPFYRWSGKPKYSWDWNKYMRSRYGSMYS